MFGYYRLEQMVVLVLVVSTVDKVVDVFGEEPDEESKLLACNNFLLTAFHDVNKTVGEVAWILGIRDELFVLEDSLH